MADQIISQEDLEREKRERKRERLRKNALKYHYAHKEEQNAKRRMRYAASAAQRQTEEWKEKARTASRLCMQRKRLADPEGYKTKQQKWFRANKDRVRIYSAKAHAKRKTTGSYTVSDIFIIRKMQRDRCAYCRKPLYKRGHIDHITAVRNGGTNNPANLQLTCARCNHRKKAKDPITFAQEIGMLL
jgi:5-methylcytosine-specific restriction endonuclease McrA